METFSAPNFNGRFSNPTSFTGWTGLPKFSEMIKFRRNEENLSAPPSAEELERTLPVRKPVFDFASKLSAIWMGHATVYVNLEGFSFITDPVWAQRVSPFSFAGPVRYRPPPCGINDIPKLDFGVISHNHYDHMDNNAIKELSKQFPEMKWFVPKGLKRSMAKLTRNEVHEMAWGEQYTLNKDGKEIQVWCVPAQHWSTRCIFDKDKSLWSGWAVTGQEKRFYFAGDTGFCEEEFGRIGRILGPFDLAAIPIGAYAPRYFMKGQHIDPEEAVRVHQLVKAKHSIGIHWGTYPMGSTEPYLEPKTKLKEEVEKAGLSANAMITVEHGSTWTENMAQHM